ncbi:long-chain fatty acid--CoA ligase [Streptomyces sp. NPDC087856]|uniref:acyl-CoA synthetase n=1 Tax=Streptomyces sp. NPDC087856 TaxID=3365811 RepID=UPI003804844E
MYLTQGLHRAVQQHPDRVMTTFGERTRTFGEVADRVARLAGGLRGIGVRRGDRVAMLALNSDRYSEYVLAVPWADAVLNPLNVRWSAAEVGYALRDSATRVLLVDDAFAPMVPALRAAYPDLDRVIHTGEGPLPEGALAYEELLAAADPLEDARRSGDQLAGLFYTGGTTGFPKGVMLSHANLITAWTGSMATGYLGGPDSLTLHVAPLFHLAGLAAWGTTLLIGGSHVIIPAFEPVAVLKAIAEHRVTDVLLVPTMIQLLVDHPEIDAHDLTSLRAMTYGASPIPQAVLERAMKALPEVSFIQAFGMTELAPVATFLGPADHVEGHRLLSAGRAAPHVEIRVVDFEDAEVPTGTVGEITVRGGNVMLGYWGQPEETRAAVRDGWMHTGDGGYLDGEGYLYIVGRLKDMIVTGGENVYAAEVENAVARHPAVAQCAVIGVPDAEWGERVHVVVVLHPGAEVELDELREHTRTLIAGYKTPRSMEVVHALPMSGAGKILKRELRRRHWTDQQRGVN